MIVRETNIDRDHILHILLVSPSDRPLVPQWPLCVDDAVVVVLVQVAVLTTPTVCTTLGLQYCI